MNIICPYCKHVIAVKDKTCDGCKRNYIAKYSKNKIVLYLKEINGPVCIPLVIYK